MAAAASRGSSDRLSQADLDQAVTCTGIMLRVDNATRVGIQAIRTVFGSA